MKPTRWESQLAATTICVLTALAAPGHAQNWVTVNPDGSVTRTEVVGPNNTNTRNYPGTFSSTDKTNQSPSSQSTSTKDKDAKTQSADKDGLKNFGDKNAHRAIIAGGVQPYHRRGHAPQTYHYPAHPGYYGQYYSYPGAAYNGPLGRPDINGYSPWITSIPLGGTFYAPSPYPAPYCPPVAYPSYPAPTYPYYPAPAYPAPAYPAPAYPYYPAPGYGYYGAPGSATTTYGQVTIGGGGTSITIGGRRHTSSSTTTTTTIRHR